VCVGPAKGLILGGVAERALMGCAAWVEAIKLAELDHLDRCTPRTLTYDFAVGQTELSWAQVWAIMPHTVGKRGSINMAVRMSVFAADLLDIEWYHGPITRHVAESLLLVSGQDGSYLLRDDQHNPGSCVLSVRSQSSVKHYEVEVDGQRIKFGLGIFDTVQEFLDHFNSQPLVGGDSGVLTTLKYPYPRNVEEPELYEKVAVHTSIGVSPANNTAHCLLPLATKEGYLTKLGQIHKVWKTRWFAVCKNELKYFKNRLDASPIRTLDLQEAIEAEMDWTYDKPNLFRSGCQ
jgi:dual adaptor for phosphotyrosine/3-phosphotyrosine/3-phosphoinositide